MPSQSFSTPGPSSLPLSGKTNLSFEIWSGGGRGGDGDNQDAGGGGGGRFVAGTIANAQLEGAENLSLTVADGTRVGDTFSSISVNSVSVVVESGTDGNDAAGGVSGTLTEALNVTLTAQYAGGAGGGHDAGGGSSSGSGGGAGAGRTADGADGTAGDTVGEVYGTGGAGANGGGSGGYGSPPGDPGATGQSPGGGGGGGGDGSSGRANGGNGLIIIYWESASGETATVLQPAVKSSAQSAGRLIGLIPYYYLRRKAS